MKRYLMLVPLVSVVVAGCSAPTAAPDPKTSLLSPGQEVVAYAADTKDSQVNAFDIEGYGVGGATLGSKLRVANDDGPAGYSRQVRVMFLEGEHKGRTGFIYRSDLRPITP